LSLTRSSAKGSDASEGASVGAVIFSAIEDLCDAMGGWYLIGLGAVALVMSLAMPRSRIGTISQRTNLRLLPVGYWVRLSSFDSGIASAH
jgi:branched-chain amino acid transport system permease protein